MALNYNATLKSARLNAVTTEVGNGGKLSIYAANGTTILATFTLGSPFAAASTAGAALAPTLPANTTAIGGGGVMTTAKIFKADGTTVVASGLTCGVGTGDIQFVGTTTVSDGVTVAISAMSIAHAA